MFDTTSDGLQGSLEIPCELNCGGQYVAQANTGNAEDISTLFARGPGHSAPKSLICRRVGSTDKPKPPPTSEPATTKPTPTTKATTTGKPTTTAKPTTTTKSEPPKTTSTTEPAGAN
ncbi:hypothetical protein FQN51_000533 [Onygenales sp. PD_10]|nr:hypothetical protein FQN51_000533 [Onygenales sp. PD_10]